MKLNKVLSKTDTDYSSAPDDLSYKSSSTSLSEGSHTPNHHSKSLKPLKSALRSSNYSSDSDKNNNNNNNLRVRLPRKKVKFPNSHTKYHRPWDLQISIFGSSSNLSDSSSNPSSGSDPNPKTISQSEISKYKIDTGKIDPKGKKKIYIWPRASNIEKTARMTSSTMTSKEWSYLPSKSIKIGNKYFQDEFEVYLHSPYGLISSSKETDRNKISQLHDMWEKQRKVIITKSAFTLQEFKERFPLLYKAPSFGSLLDLIDKGDEGVDGGDLDLETWANERSIYDSLSKIGGGLYFENKQEKTGYYRSIPRPTDRGDDIPGLKKHLIEKIIMTTTLADDAKIQFLYSDKAMKRFQGILEKEEKDRQTTVEDADTVSPSLEKSIPINSSRSKGKIKRLSGFWKTWRSHTNLLEDSSSPKVYKNNPGKSTLNLNSSTTVSSSQTRRMRTEKVQDSGDRPPWMTKNEALTLYPMVYKYPFIGEVLGIPMQQHNNNEDTQPRDIEDPKGKGKARATESRPLHVVNQTEEEEEEEEDDDDDFPLFTQQSEIGLPIRIPTSNEVELEYMDLLDPEYYTPGSYPLGLPSPFLDTYNDNDKTSKGLNPEETSTWAQQMWKMINNGHQVVVRPNSSSRSIRSDPIINERHLRNLVDAEIVRFQRKVGKVREGIVDVYSDYCDLRS